VKALSRKKVKYPKTENMKHRKTMQKLVDQSQNKAEKSLTLKEIKYSDVGFVHSVKDSVTLQLFCGLQFTHPLCGDACTSRFANTHILPIVTPAACIPAGPHFTFCHFSSVNFVC